MNDPFRETKEIYRVLVAKRVGPGAGRVDNGAKAPRKRRVVADIYCWSKPTAHLY
jgi:hypothetical protein